MTIEHDRAPHSSALCHGECIEWMPIGLIFAIFDLDEYRECSLSHDDIELSSLDLVVAIDDLVSPRLEISHGDILSYISDGAIGLCHIFL